MSKKATFIATTKTAALALTVAMVVHTPQTQAGAVVGATEFTQIANNIELVMQYSKQVESYVTQVRQYKAQLENMRRLDPSKLAGLLKGAMGDNLPAELERRLKNATEMGDRVTSLSRSMRNIYREGRIAADSIKGMELNGVKMSGRDYLEAMRKLAEMREEGYEDRLNMLMQNSREAMSDIKRVEALARLAPELSTEMEGTAALLQSNAVMSGQLGSIVQAITATSVTQTEAAAADVERRDEERQERKLKEMEVMRNLAPTLKGSEVQ